MMYVPGQIISVRHLLGVKFNIIICFELEAFEDNDADAEGLGSVKKGN